MKNIIYIIFAALLFGSCSKDIPVLEEPFSAIDLDIIVQKTEVQNVYRFINGKKGQTATAKWDLGNSEKAVGDTVLAKYPFKGDYNIVLTVFNGVTAVQKTVKLSLDQDNVSLDPVYNLLTGGTGAVNGKTWVLDSLVDGHVRLINSGSNTPWNKMARAGKGVYDDEMNFKLAGRECTYLNNNTSYVHGGTIDGVTQYRLKELNSVWGTATNPKADGGDLTINYVPKKAVQSWSMEIRNGKHYLKLNDGAFFFFYRGCSNVIEYEITAISENEMTVTHYESIPASRASANWRDVYSLIVKGYKR